jgi:hypothetical protein
VDISKLSDSSPHGPIEDLTGQEELDAIESSRHFVKESEVKQLTYLASEEYAWLRYLLKRHRFAK